MAIRDQHERYIRDEWKRLQKEKGQARARERKERAKELARANDQRQPRERNNVFLAYVRRLPCIIGWGCSGGVDACHIRYSNPKVGRINPGMGAKPSDRWVLPACRGHHHAQHMHGDERGWWALWNVDADQVAQDLFADFEAGGHHGAEIIMRHRKAANIQRAETRDD